MLIYVLHGVECIKGYQRLLNIIIINNMSRINKGLEIILMKKRMKKKLSKYFLHLKNT